MTTRSSSFFRSLAQLQFVTLIASSAASFAQSSNGPVNAPLPPPHCVTTNGRQGVDTSVVTSQDPCNDPTITAQGTQCWYSVFLPEHAEGFEEQDYTRGFPMNLSLAFGPGAPDYPPVSTDVATSNSPLVPAQGPLFRGPMSFPTRTTVNGVIDVVTGAPLLREVDFELPFGGATFRHVRTYSELPTSQWHESEYGQPVPFNGSDNCSTEFPSGVFYPLPHMGRMGARAAEETYWDWHGHGWMMGENPAFLFDAHYDIVVKKPLPNGSTTPPRCYFLIDAHQSIPFERTQQLDGDGRPLYIAPPQFDAKMKVLDGVWNQVGGFWQEFPTQVSVWTHNSTVRYNITIGHGDAPWITVSNPSHSYRLPLTPLLGLVQEIRDRLGNRVVMDYLDVTRYSVGAPTGSTSCLECQQNCHRRGVLRSVKLFAKDKTVPDWTVLYTYREFADNRWSTSSDETPVLSQTLPPEYVFDADSRALRVHRQVAIHGIYVYVGDVTPPSDPVIRAAIFDSVNGTGHELARELDGQALRASTLLALPADWVIECRYMYGIPIDDPDAPSLASDMAGPYPMANNRGPITNIEIWDQTQSPNLRGWAAVDSTPRLVKATVARRELVDSQWTPLPERTSLYRYAGFKCHSGREYSSYFLAQVLLPEQTSQALDLIRKNLSLNFPGFDDPQSSCGPCGCPIGLPSACVTDSLGTRLVLDDSWLMMIPSNNLIRYVSELDPTVIATTSVGAFATIHNTHIESEAVPHTSYGTSRGRGFSISDALAFAGLQASDPRLLHVDSGNANHSIVGGEGLYQVRSIARFMLRPEGTYPVFNERNGIDTVSACACDKQGQPRYSRAISHFPYRYVDNPSLRDDETQWLDTTNADAFQPFWIVVIKQADVRHVIDDESPDPLNPLLVVKEEVFNDSIRVVRLNRAGILLSDTTFPIKQENAGGTPDAPWIVAGPDVGEIREYDNANRLTTLKTKGYTVGDATQRQSAGAIYRYEYHSAAPVVDVFATIAPANAVNDVASISVQRGDSGTPYVLEQFWYHSTERSLVTKHRVFTEPVTLSGAAGALSGSFADTDTSYVLSSDAAIVRTQARSSGVPIDSSGDLFAAVTDEVFSSQNGMLLSRCVGMQRLGASGEIVETDGRNTRFCTENSYATYTVNGVLRTSNRLSATIVDVLSSSNLSRKDGVVNFDPLAASTQFTAPWFGSRQTSIVQSPDGSREYRLERDLGAGKTEVHTYRNVWPTSGGDFSIKSPVQVDEFQDGVLIETTLRSLTGFGSSGPTPFTPVSAPIVSTVRPQFDSRGRPIEAAIDAGPLPIELRFQMQLDSWGNPVRTRDIHGNITRRVYTFDGLLEKTYVGTKDEHEVWGTADPTPINPCEPAYSDNLVLTEKLSYGSGESDARQLVSARRYDRRPDNQYMQDVIDGCPPVPANNEDAIGKLQRFGYDWRMRRVWTETYESGVFPPSRPTSVTAQYLDVQNRVRFEAVYPTVHIPSSSPCDPRKAVPGAAVPTASQLLACNPVSLTENVYDARGNVAEVRTYRTDGGGYVATRSRYDHENRVIWSESPDSGIQQTWYDARGDVRVVIESANGIITRRTDYTVDVMGNVITQVSRERTHDGTGIDLTDANSVADVKHSWYQYGQLIATADLGSNGTSDAWGGTTAAVSRPAIPPTYSAGVIQMNGLPAHARVQVFDYDEFGRQILSVAHDGTATRTEYDDLGRVTLVVENADAQISLSHLRRATAYQYDERGRLSQIAAVPGYNGTNINWTATDGSVQVTRLEYNASVVDDSAEPAVMSPEAFDASRIARVLFPNPRTGQPDGLRGFEYSYLPSGHLARRIDLDSLAELYYAYDSRNNLTRVKAQQHPMRSGKVTDMTTLNVYIYDTLSRLTHAWARNEAGGTVAMDGFAYDHFGNLKWEIQQHGGALSTLDGRVDYTWDFNSARNSNRLTEIKYPDRDVSAGVSRRHVRLGYGTAGSVSDVLSRITTISDSDVLNGTPLQRGEFTYSAGGARVKTTLGAESGTVPAVAQWQAWSGTSASNGYTGLNRFGQALDLHVTNLNGAGSTLYRAQSTYDNMGNRRTSRITQANADNTRSWKFDYDALQRLMSADMGALSSGLIVDPSGGFKRTTAWNLDSLGNWTGSPTAAGRVETGVFSGSAVTTRTVTHRMAGIASPTDVNGDNIIKQLHRTDSAGGSPTSENIAYDASGNLICDEHYVYYYDAFNRLVQVNQRGGATVAADGELNDSELGPWIRHYTYDALGRLIRTQSPYPEPSFDAYVARSERYYYDGLRRIQEVHVTPTNIEQMFAMAEATGDPSESGGPVSGESEVIESEIAAGNVTGQPPFAEQFNFEIEPGPGMEFNTWIDREYVWGPGDRGFDELICQHTPARDNVAASVEYAVHDDAGDLVALLNRASPTGHGRVAWQATYDPYGQPRVAEMPSGVTFGFAYPRIGHKGLFVERLDTTTMLGTERLVSNARLLYHARNRWLHPSLGRWTSRDPNGLGQPVSGDTLCYFGRTCVARLSSLDLERHFADGLSTSAYVRNDPLKNADPLGLESVPSLSVNMATRVPVMATQSSAIVQAGSAVQTTVSAAPSMGIVAVGGLKTSATTGVAMSTGAKLIVYATAGAMVIGPLGQLMMAASDEAARVPGESPLPGEPSKGRFATGTSGMVQGSVTIDGKRLDYIVDYRWEPGARLHLKPILYPPSGVVQQRVGGDAVRSMFEQLRQEAMLSGAKWAQVTYNRVGSTGGVRDREVALPPWEFP